MIRPYQAAGALRVELHGLQTSAAEYHMPSHRVKGRREVVVPLSPLAVEVIGLTNSENQIPVFPSRYGEEPQAIRRSALSSALNGRPAKKKRPIRKGIRQFLGMEHFTPHDLRRTAATIARRAGAPRDDVKAVLDHVDGDVTAVADELRKIIGTKSDSAKPALNFDRSNVVPVEEQISVTGQI
jgi:integrase